MTNNRIKELIERRMRQVLVHSIIYYKFNDNLVTDDQWAKWALELENLLRDYPDIAKTCTYAKAFEGFDHSSGYNLPLDDPWGVRKATMLIAWRDAKLKGEITYVEKM